jgi:dTDP-4-amino-4,6-dideoxygalactose transaminase
MGHNSRFSAGATVTLIPAQGHGRRFLGRKRHLLAALADVIESGGASGKYTQGPRVAALEELMEERWHVASAIAVNSGSSALRLACEGLCLEAGREVLVPALTFISTAYAVSDAGLVPVFVDVDPQTLTLDPSAAQAAMTRKTSAILPVHLHGQMADMFPLLDLADTYGLYIVEDAAQAQVAARDDGPHSRDGLDPLWLRMPGTGPAANTVDNPSGRPGRQPVG